MARGIPSVAVSYAGTPERSYRDLSADAIEMREAGVVQRLIASLKTNRHGKALLPAGVGLSVNVPAFDDDTQAGDLAFKFTSISCIGARDDFFVPLNEDASNTDSAPRLGYGRVDDDEAAGLGIDFNCPQDQTPKGVPPAEAVALNNGFVTVTPIQVTVQAFRSQRNAARIRVQDLVTDSTR
ncbi:hypothetical protein [Salinisphaera japonica]|uniref:5'-nucleotidase n=1 Tax=Salinisphaera japonica YTM-1 TaxID=1209778 RepID=A0A423Q0C3_9GAMM|nr:hypothetical protein [Salinisphaera japonica]ROO31454.1 hypothetical protein SAJA_02690 [Salinisphaera japonica YTM-1]